MGHQPNGWRAGRKKSALFGINEVILRDRWWVLMGVQGAGEEGGKRGLNPRMNDVGGRIDPRVEVVKKGYICIDVYSDLDLGFTL